MQVFSDFLFIFYWFLLLLCCCFFVLFLFCFCLHSLNLTGHIRAERNNGIKFKGVTSDLIVILLSFISIANMKKKKKKKFCVLRPVNR